VVGGECVVFFTRIEGRVEYKEGYHECEKNNREDNYEEQGQPFHEFRISITFWATIAPKTTIPPVMRYFR
jgi:hypothetical protein